MGWAKGPAGCFPLLTAQPPWQQTAVYRVLVQPEELPRVLLTQSLSVQNPPGRRVGPLLTATGGGVRAAALGGAAAARQGAVP